MNVFKKNRDKRFHVGKTFYTIVSFHGHDIVIKCYITEIQSDGFWFTIQGQTGMECWSYADGDKFFFWSKDAAQAALDRFFDK